MKYKTGYQIGSEGQLLGIIRVRENPRRAGDFPCSKNVIFISPKELKAFQTQKWNGEEWIIYSDFRGKWWNKKTAEETEVTEINIEVSDVTFTNKPPDGRFNHQYFNDISGVWEENVIAKEAEEKEARIAEIKSKLTSLDIKKIRFLLEKEKGVLSGKIYFDGYEEETVLLRDQLKELENESTMYS